jgi:uncharacterized protein DUF4232
MNKFVLGAAALVAAAFAVPAAAHAGPIAPCASGQVQISDAWSQGASGHYATYLEFSLTPGAAPCTLTGYPGVDQTGPDAPVLHAERTPSGFFPSALPRGTDTPPTLVVSSWQPGYALVEGRAVDGQGIDCPTYDQLHVTAPDTTETVTLPTTVGCVLQIHPIGSGEPRPATH